MLKSLSTSLILRGLLALVIGVTALAWPGVTVFALVIFSAVPRLPGLRRSAAGVPAARLTRAQPPTAAAIVDLAAGVIALAWPAPTALVLVLIVASWAIIGGLFEFYAGFRADEFAGTRATYFLGGLVSFAFGVALFAHPGVGAVTLALLFGIFNLIYGIWQLTVGIEVRQTTKGVDITHRVRQHTECGAVKSQALLRRSKLPWRMACRLVLTKGAAMGFRTAGFRIRRGTASSSCAPTIAWRSPRPP